MSGLPLLASGEYLFIDENHEPCGEDHLPAGRQRAGTMVDRSLLTDVHSDFQVEQRMTLDKLGISRRNGCGRSARSET